MGVVVLRSAFGLFYSGDGIGLCRVNYEGSWLGIRMPTMSSTGGQAGRVEGAGSFSIRWCAVADSRDDIAGSILPGIISHASHVLGESFGV